MRLISSDGASISLHPAAYQFEVTPAVSDGQDWDANWLMIQGDVRTADGRQWAFLDPCLTTWEARSLSGWLHGVAAGDGAAERRPIAFTEPNLAFSLDGRRAGRVRLRACFSHEALPPWVPRDHDGWQGLDPRGAGHRPGGRLRGHDHIRAGIPYAPPAWVGGVIMIGYTVALVAGGIALTKRRDVT